jgi:diguanylate cyclase (GGDEF)-like protein/PAS domain S-box-containing protein
MSPRVDIKNDATRGLANAVFRQSFDGVYLVDTMRNIEDWNGSAESISGYSREQMVGHKCSDNFLVHVDEQGRQLCGELCPLQATIEDGCPRQARVYLRHKQGHRVPVDVRTEAVCDSTGTITGAIEIFRQVSSCEELSGRMVELERLAFLDKLTNLPNRRFAENRLSLLMMQFRNSEIGFSVLLIDLDHFKNVNDLFGHAAGDAVLQSVSMSLEAGLRSSDLVARWGGEEFIVLIGSKSTERLASVGERSRSLVANTVARTGGKELVVTASIGGAAISCNEDLPALLQRMDGCLYESKRRGRNRVTIDQ